MDRVELLTYLFLVPTINEYSESMLREAYKVFREKAEVLDKQLTAAGIPGFELYQNFTKVRPPKVEPKTIATIPNSNLIYHVTPVANYKWNIEQLLQRWHVFTGRKVIAVAQGTGIDGLDDLAYVQAMLPRDAELIRVPNDITLRETVSFPLLLDEASRFDRSGITFYAHTKGVTRKEDPAVQLWTLASYHYNLDYAESIAELRKKFPVFGTFKRLGSFPNFPKNSRWHFSGTFFWFRNADLFAKAAWNNVPRMKYGTEAYLSTLFTEKQAGVTFGRHIHNLYSEPYIRKLLEDDGFTAKIAAYGIKY